MTVYGMIYGTAEASQNIIDYSLLLGIHDQGASACPITRSHSGPRKPCWQKPCWQIYAHGLHGYVGASARVAPLESTTKTNIHGFCQHGFRGPDHHAG